MKNSQCGTRMFTVLLSLMLLCPLARTEITADIPLAPEQNRRPANYQPGEVDKSPETMIKYSDEMRKLAAQQYKELQQVNENGLWKATAASIDEHHAPEWFLDAKFGMFIDWGPWSVAGWAPKKESGAMYPDWYEYRLDTDSAFIAYHAKNWGRDFKRDDFLPLFTAANYQPDQLVHIAKQAGMKYIVPFCKHHGGFCLWPSSFTQRDAVDMGPQRDLIEPLVASCREAGLKFGFYFSIEEWEYPLLGADNELLYRGWGDQVSDYQSALDDKLAGKIPVRDFGTEYIVPQAKEFIDVYDPDILWYDGDWNTDVNKLHSYDISAYFYNHAQGRKDVAVNDRCGGQPGERWQRSVRGDFFTNEYGDMEKEAKQTIHAWEECRGISQSFGYNWQDTEKNVITSKAFIDMFVDIVAHGGNLLLIVNLDGQGALPNVQEDRLRDIGRWLNINGEGIYATRPFYPYVADSLAYTQSKDGKFVYAILKEWPGGTLLLPDIQPAEQSDITLLGSDAPLAWTYTASGLTVTVPGTPDERLKYAWILKIKVKD